ncbi:hypothetical protein GGI12_004766, partial [Dipsacomyces acuminosporus]
HYPYSEPPASGGYAAAGALAVSSEYPQTQPLTQGYASTEAVHAGHAPYYNAYPSEGYNTAEDTTPHQAPANDALLEHQQFYSSQAQGYTAQMTASGDTQENAGGSGAAQYGADHAIPALSPIYGSEVNAGSQRAVSSLSAPTVPPPAAVFDFHSHSERTSAELSHHDRVLDTSTQDRANAGVSDPLGRLGALRPTVSFGFGGRLVTMFPRQVQRFNMYDSGNASKVVPGMVRVQQLCDHMPPDLCAASTAAYFSTPLLTGETARPALLKRRDVAVACAKAWVEHATSMNALDKEEKVLYEVVIAILNSFEQTETTQMNLNGALETIRSLFATNDTSAAATTAQVDPASANARAPIAHGDKAQLQAIEALLLEGKREEAVSSACAQGLWAHALIIASCTGKDLWQSAVSAYTEGVLKDGMSALGIQYRIFSGLGQKALDRPRPFHKRDPSAVEDKFITAADIQGPEQQGWGGGSSATPRDDADHAVQDWAKTLSLMLANRTSGDHTAMLRLGDKLKDSGDTIASHICYALTLHGKEVFLPESIDAFPRASLLGVSETAPKAPPGAAAFDMHRDCYSRYYRKQSAICLTELYEVAFALRAVTINDSRAPGAAGNAAGTGNSSSGTAVSSNGSGGTKSALPFCLPHLQAYKLYYAWWLVDCGQTALASRYCDAVLSILSTLPQGVAVPFIHASLVQELRNLRERLTGAGMSSVKAAEIVGDEAAIAGGNPKSWLSRAMPRPSFTSLMSAFDSSIDKFITGADGDRIPLDSNGASTPGRYEVGPDRQGGQPRPGSDQPRQPHAPGAAGYDGLTPSPRAVPAGIDGTPPSNFASHAAQAQSTNVGAGTYYADGYVDSPSMFSPVNPASQADQSVPNFVQDQSQPKPVSQPQWGDPGHDASSGQGAFITPGLPYDLNAASSYSSAALAPQPVADLAAPAPVPQTSVDDDDEEDMFGFSKKKKTPSQPAQDPSRPGVDAARSSAPPARPSADGGAAKERSSTDGKGGAKDDGNNSSSSGGAKDDGNNSSSSGGMFGILKNFWGGRKNQANLGEESKFVYDPVQQRWVDKNAPSDQQDSGPPLPPPPSMMKFLPTSASVPPQAGPSASPPTIQNRQQSLSAAATPPGAAVGSIAPPPSRPMSAIPPSSSATSSRAGTPSSVAMGGMPPPSSGSARVGRRRGARTKYVDLLNQQ